MSVQSEIWKYLPGWEGMYQVSNYGQIRSMPRPGRTQFGGRMYGGNVLKAILCSNGYLAVNLTDKGKRKQVMLHRAVLEAFCGMPPVGMEACHNNGLRTDNRLWNLRWDTRKNNHADKKKHGTWQGGENNPFSKLTEAQAKEAKYSRLPLKVLARKFNVSFGAISKIRYGDSWKHV